MSDGELFSDHMKTKLIKDKQYKNISGMNMIRINDLDSNLVSEGNYE